jgi:hypothetical protein
MRKTANFLSYTFSLTRYFNECENSWFSVLHFQSYSIFQWVWKQLYFPFYTFSLTRYFNECENNWFSILHFQSYTIFQWVWKQLIFCFLSYMETADFCLTLSILHDISDMSECENLWFSAFHFHSLVFLTTFQRLSVKTVDSCLPFSLNPTLYFNNVQYGTNNEHGTEAAPLRYWSASTSRYIQYVKVLCDYGCWQYCKLFESVIPGLKGDLTRW